MSKNPFETIYRSAPEAIPDDADILKKTALDEKSSFEEVSQAIDTLIFIMEQGENMEYEVGEDPAEKTLKEIYASRKEYFLRLKISKALALPLENMDIGYKKALLERDGINLDNHSDKQIEKTFLNFIYENYEFCRWCERSFYKTAVKEKGYDAYGFGTYQDDELSGEAPRTERIKLENSVFAKLCNGYGVKYVSDDSIQVFRADPTFEADQKRRRETYGQSQEGDIHFYATHLQRNFAKHSYLQSLHYICGLGLLNEQRVTEVLAKHALHIPEELLDGSNTFAEREHYTQEHKVEVSQLISALEDKNVASDILSLMQGIEQAMIDEAKEKYFGYKSFNTDQLDFFLSFYYQSPLHTHPPHHTFFYYAYMRKFLPETLVDEFEKKFQIEIPAIISNIELYDDFLNVSEGTLFQTFGRLDREAIDWLRERLIELANSIQSVLPKAEYIPIKEFFIENSLPEERLTDEFIANYSSLMSLPIRAEVEKKFGVSLANFDARTQIQLLHFLSTLSEGEVGSYASIINNSDDAQRKKDLINLFVCLEFDETNFLAAENIKEVVWTPEVADIVVPKLASLVSTADALKNFLEQSFKSKFDTKSLAILRTRLIEKAFFLLQDTALKTRELFSFQAKLMSLRPLPYITEGNLDEYDRQREEYESLYEKALQNISKTFQEEDDGLTMLLQALITLKESGVDFSLEDVNDNKITMERGEDLAEDVFLMRKLYLESMAGYPAEIQDELLENFDANVMDKNSSFSVLRYKKKVAGFACFTEKVPNQKIVSAVTLDPRFQKAYIGEALIKQSFDREAKENILGADCVAQKSVSSRYIENGFIGVRAWDDRGDLILDIVRDDRRNERYFSTKALSSEEIVRLSPLGKIDSARIEVVADPKEHSFALCNQGFVLTRYFKDAATKKWYLVYEPMPTPKTATEKIPEEALAEV